MASRDTGAALALTQGLLLSLAPLCGRGGQWTSDCPPAPRAPRAPPFLSFKTRGPLTRHSLNFPASSLPPSARLWGGRWDTLSPHSYPLEGHPFKILLPALLSLTSPLYTAGATKGPLALLPLVTTTRLTGRHAGPSSAGPSSTARLSREPLTSQGALREGPWLASTGKLPLLSTCPPPYCPFPPPRCTAPPPPPIHRAPTFLSPFCHPYLGKSSLFHPPSDSVRFAAGYKT